MQKFNLLDTEVHHDLKGRIESLRSDSTPLWGKMTAAQMLAHCCEVQLVANGQPLTDTPFIVKMIGGLIRKSVVNEKPYPHNSRTHPQYVVDDARDFEAEKARLLKALDAFVTMSDAELDRIEHPLFGKLSRDEKGWSMYKHHDHHLRQFGV